jgi:hypothetical protein
LVRWAGGGMLLLLAAAAGGCTASSREPAPAPGARSGNPASSAVSPPPFVEPASYRYVLVRGCDTGSPLGRYRVTVRDGAVVASERIDSVTPAVSGAPAVDLGPIGGQHGEDIGVPTLGQLLELAQRAADDGGQVTTAADPADGHPVRVTIDVESPECFAVIDYQR